MQSQSENSPIQLWTMWLVCADAEYYVQDLITNVLWFKNRAKQSQLLLFVLPLLMREGPFKSVTTSTIPARRNRIVKLRRYRCDAKPGGNLDLSIYLKKKHTLSVVLSESSMDNVSLSQMKHSKDEVASPRTDFGSSSSATPLDDDPSTSAIKKASFATLPNTTTWQQQQLFYQQSDNNGRYKDNLHRVYILFIYFFLTSRRRPAARWRHEAVNDSHEARRKTSTNRTRKTSNGNSVEQATTESWKSCIFAGH